jgi:hypothetical protein
MHARMLQTIPCNRKLHEYEVEEIAPICGTNAVA